MGYEHTADYEHINVALKSQWDVFHSLKAEMESFAANPPAYYDGYRAAEVKRICELNPTAPEQEIATLVDKMLKSSTSPEAQFYDRFNDRHMTVYVTVVLLSHSLCESLINVILATGLFESGAVELFSVLEKAEFRKKWLVGPKSLSPGYEFPRGTALHETLNHLVSQRNALVHNKVTLHSNGEKVLDGSVFRRTDFLTEQAWLHRFFSLPYDLADFMRMSIPTRHIYLLDRRPIEPASAHVQIARS